MGQEAIAGAYRSIRFCPVAGWSELDGNQTYFDKRLGANLKKLRTKRGLSLADIASEVGISYQQLQKHEAGRNSLSIHRTLKIANVLEVEVQTILDMMISNPSAEELPKITRFQRVGERQRLLDAYFSLPEEISTAFLDLIEITKRHKDAQS